MQFWAFLLFSISAHAIRIPFEVHRGVSHPNSLFARQSSNTSNVSIPLANSQNAVYVSNITLGGRTIPVLVDTGSSDLWVVGDVPGAKDSNEAVKLKYAVGQAAGDIFFGKLAWESFTVPDQAFLLVPNASTFSTNITAQGYNGLVGLGPNTGSLIKNKLDMDGPGGDAVMDRIFGLNQTEQNYITFMLDRLRDPGNNITGQFTISEVVPGFESILNEPKLPVVKVHTLTDRDQHWQVYTDKNGFIGPDGQPIVHESIAPKAPDDQLVVVIDSGFTLPQVPRAMSDAIYGRVQGAEWSVANNLWTIPCSQMLNISINLGGKAYPIHPLDAVSSDFGLTDSTGKPVCAGTFQPITSAFSLLGEYDIILGMGFLRNTYTLIDFGNFVEASTKDRNAPYVQLLSVTDVNKAHDDFVKARLNGVDTTNDPSQALLPASQGKKSPLADGEKKALLAAKVLSRWPYIMMGCLLLLFGLVGFCIWRFCLRKRIAAKKAAKQAKKKESGGGFLQMSPIGGGGQSPYKQLNSPGSGSPHPPPYASDVFSDKYQSHA